MANIFPGLALAVCIGIAKPGIVKKGLSGDRGIWKGEEDQTALRGRPGLALARVGWIEDGRIGRGLERRKGPGVLVSYLQAGDEWAVARGELEDTRFGQEEREVGSLRRYALAVRPAWREVEVASSQLFTPLSLSLSLSSLSVFHCSLC
ncbi:hypothetical protein PMIN02_010933 [Paraphaeosphaeria minitans]